MPKDRFVPGSTPYTEVHPFGDHGGVENRNVGLFDAVLEFHGCSKTAVTNYRRVILLPEDTAHIMLSTTRGDRNRPNHTIAIYPSFRGRGKENNAGVITRDRHGTIRGELLKPAYIGLYNLYAKTEFVGDVQKRKALSAIEKAYSEKHPGNSSILSEKEIKDFLHVCKELMGDEWPQLESLPVMRSSLDQATLVFQMLAGTKAPGQAVAYESTWSDPISLSHTLTTTIGDPLHADTIIYGRTEHHKNEDAITVTTARTWGFFSDNSPVTYHEIEDVVDAHFYGLTNNIQIGKAGWIRYAASQKREQIDLNGSPAADENISKEGVTGQDLPTGSGRK